MYLFVTQRDINTHVDTAKQLIYYSFTLAFDVLRSQMNQVKALVQEGYSKLLISITDVIRRFSTRTSLEQKVGKK